MLQSIYHTKLINPRIQNLLLLLIMLICISCANQGKQISTASNFNIRCDTVALNVNSLNPDFNFSAIDLVCEYKGNYIIKFDTWDENFYDSLELYSLKQDLSSITVFSRPAETLYITDLFVRHDSLIAYTRNDLFKYFQYFDSNNNKWKKLLPNTDNNFLNFYRYYEDEEYLVNISVREEGLEYLVFVDKLTNSKHLFQTFNLVQLIKLNGTYYCIGDAEITTIPHPRKGKYTESVASKLYVDNSASYPDSLIKIRSYSKEYTPDTTFCASIVLNNNLFILTKDKNEFYISQLKGNQLVKVCDLSKSISIMGFGYKNRHIICGNNRIILPFYWIDEFGEYRSGILDIQDSDFHFIHF